MHARCSSLRRKADEQFAGEVAVKKEGHGVDEEHRLRRSLTTLLL
jgi:hypothetical protein